MSKLSIIVASSGRSSLKYTQRSILSQVKDGDEMLVDINADGDWGHAARNRQIINATGDAVMFMDDDDVYLEGALEIVRAAFSAAPENLHMFAMKYAEDGRLLGPGHFFACGHVSTQMVVAPRRKIVLDGDLLASFGTTYEGDWTFIEAAGKILGEPIWHDEPIALIRPMAAE